jgi:hypothetical protein
VSFAGGKTRPAPLQAPYLAQEAAKLAQAGDRLVQGEVPLQAEGLVQELNAKLRGYYTYYGVKGNSASLREFFT